MQHFDLFDKSFQEKLTNNPKLTLAELKTQIPEDVELVVVTNTKDTTYLAMPAASQALNLENIQATGAASTTSTIGSLGSAGTFSTVGGTALCIASIGTAGSLGSVKTDSSTTVNL